VATDGEFADPQMYRDDKGIVRRKPGRPRKNPMATQAELRSKNRASASERLKEGRVYVEGAAAEVLKANLETTGLRDALVQLVDMVYQACTGTNLELTPDEMRIEASKALTAELGKVISPAGVLDWQADRLKAFMAQQQTLTATMSAPVHTEAPPAAIPAPAARINGREVDIHALMEEGLPSSDD
jgi:hypothetical protein